MTQSIQEQIGIMSAVEPEDHFFAVSLEMLRAWSRSPRHSNSRSLRSIREDGDFGMTAQKQVRRHVFPATSWPLPQAPRTGSLGRPRLFRPPRGLFPRLDCLISRARLTVDPGALSRTWAAIPGH